jgi:predicted nucleic acid-binding protein
MKIAFDSSVIIAGTHEMHPHHRRAIVWIELCSTNESQA